MESCGSRLVHNIFCDSRTHVDCSLGEAHFYWPFAAVYVHLHGIFRCICADHLASICSFLPCCCLISLLFFYNFKKFNKNIKNASRERCAKRRRRCWLHISVRALSGAHSTISSEKETHHMPREYQALNARSKNDVVRNECAPATLTVKIPLETTYIVIKNINHILWCWLLLIEH